MSGPSEARAKLGGSRVLHSLNNELRECHERASEDQRRAQEVHQPVVVQLVERQAAEDDDDAAPNEEDALPLGSDSRDRGVEGHASMMHHSPARLDLP